MKKYKLETIPGKEFRYSGFIAPEILALILEKVYQKPYQKLLETFILEKAQMNHNSMQITVDSKKYILNGYTDGNQINRTITDATNRCRWWLKINRSRYAYRYIQFLLKEDKSVMKKMSKTFVL